MSACGSRVVQFDEISAKEFVKVFSSLMKDYQDFGSAAARELDDNRLPEMKKNNQIRKDLLLSLPSRVEEIFLDPSKLEYVVVMRIRNYIDGLHDLDVSRNGSFPETDFLDRIIETVKKAIG